VSPDDVKLIAFYLPQFHPIPENDAWWGPGFTEWRNVVQGRAAFKGHDQPRIPGELGFYDLRLHETRQAQADLARAYGIFGFCYYYYWFNGRKLLQQPLEEVYKTGKPDFPFCICWANENWTRTWDGLDQEVLIAQEHTSESDEAFIVDVLPLLRDPRYIRVEGKPLLLVYRVNLLPDPQATAARWRQIAAQAGLPGLELCAVQSFGIEDPRPFGFDASVEFPPHGYFHNSIGRDGVERLDNSFEGFLYDYRRVVSNALLRPTPAYRQYRGVMPGWDNTARRRHAAHIYHHSSPELYGRWLHEVCEQARVGDIQQPVVFINAWNEWAEGACLEPDLRSGRAYLKATRQAVTTHEPTPAAAQKGAHIGRNRPLISVVIPSYNHARFIATAIRSVASQDYPHVELIVIDDGSTDGSLEAVEQTSDECGIGNVTIRTQSNLGAAAAIDRGVMLSSGEYVAVLNSDDFYLPGRLSRLLEKTDPGRHAFTFSGVQFCDEYGQAVSGGQLDSLMHWYRGALLNGVNCPTAGFALLCSSVTVTTSNFFFSRALFDDIGGFNNKLVLCHDWEFVLSALRFAEPTFVPTPLLGYRYHGKNTILRDVGMEREQEGARVLGAFSRLLSEPPVNPLAPHPHNWGEFFSNFIGSHSPWFSARTLATFIESPVSTSASVDKHLTNLEAPLPRDTQARMDLTDLSAACQERWKRTQHRRTDVIALT
jgi:hypothetical protein